MSEEYSSSEFAKETKIYILYTGGTFGMTEKGALGTLQAKGLGGPDGLLADLDPVNFDFNKPGKPGFISHEVEEISPPIDSSSMTPSDWVRIVEKIEKNYNLFDGFIIIQGTDTLSYTASALSFMLENLAKPVIVTGSQLPLEKARSDGRLNYGHALELAAYQVTDQPKISEVIVVFADKVLRGCRTRKMSASAWTGFDTPNCPVLGEIGEHLSIQESQLRPPPSENLEFQTVTDLETQVLDMAIFPGLTAEMLSTILTQKTIQGIVLRTYGSGNAPEGAEFLEAIRTAAIDNQKTIVNITQCPQGSVEMGLYQASMGLVENGVISGMDMTPEAALTKLMVNMKNRSPEQLRLQMQVDQRGEQSYSLFELTFEAPSGTKDRYDGEVIPDRRFVPEKMTEASFRMLDAEFHADNMHDVFVDVFMNDRAASRDEPAKMSDRRGHVARITPDNLENGTVVKNLSKVKTLRRIGDSTIPLTLITSSEDVKFSCFSLSLAIRTQS